MRIIFMGTPAFAVPTLAALIHAGHEVACVYTQPPRPAKRGQRDQQSAVHNFAAERSLMVRTPASLKDSDVRAAFAALDADIAVVAAYGLLLPQIILDAPRHGCLNVHASLLPRWRGAAPIQRAILAGDRETGVAIMQMAAGMDTGPVRHVEATAIGHKTTGILTDELAQIGARLVVQVLNDLNAYPPLPQSAEGVLHAPKIDKSEAEIDWHLSAVQIERSVRAFAPAPGAWFAVGDERIKLLSADVMPPELSDPPAAPGTVLDDQLTIACNPGAIRATIVQRAGRGPMRAEDLLRGFTVPAGTRLA